MPRIIHIHADAPLKPGWGEPCNGCGVCCGVAPCPVGMLVSRKRQGACDLLRWDDEGTRYVCGLLAAPTRIGLLQAPARLATRLARRLIAAGSGCDCDLEVEASTSP